MRRVLLPSPVRGFLKDWLRPMFVALATCATAAMLSPLEWKAASVTLVLACASLLLAFWRRRASRTRSLGAAAVALATLLWAAVAPLVIEPPTLFVVWEGASILRLPIDEQAMLSPSSPDDGRVLLLRNPLRIPVARLLARWFPGTAEELVARSVAPGQYSLTFRRLATLLVEMRGAVGGATEAHVYIGFAALGLYASIASPFPLRARPNANEPRFELGIAVSQCELLTVAEKGTPGLSAWNEVTFDEPIVIVHARYAARLREGLLAIARGDVSRGMRLFALAHADAPSALEQARIKLLMAKVAACIAQGNIGDLQSVGLYNEVYSEILPAIEREQGNLSARVGLPNRAVLEGWIFRSLANQYQNADNTAYRTRVRTLEQWLEHQATDLRGASRADVRRELGLPRSASDSEVVLRMLESPPRGLFEQWSDSLHNTPREKYLEVLSSFGSGARYEAIQATVANVLGDFTGRALPALLRGPGTVQARTEVDAASGRGQWQLGIADSLASLLPGRQRHSAAGVVAAAQALLAHMKWAVDSGWTLGEGAAPPPSLDTMTAVDFPCVRALFRWARGHEGESARGRILVVPSECEGAPAGAWWDRSYLDSQVGLMARLVAALQRKAAGGSWFLAPEDLRAIVPEESRFVVDEEGRLYLPAALLLARFSEGSSAETQRQDDVARILGIEDYRRALRFQALGPVGSSGFLRITLRP